MFFYFFILLQGGGIADKKIERPSDWQNVIPLWKKGGEIPLRDESLVDSNLALNMLNKVLEGIKMRKRSDFLSKINTTDVSSGPVKLQICQKVFKKKKSTSKFI